MKVLIAEDNHDAGDTLATFLRYMGHDVRVAYDGESAVNAACAYKPDVVVLDFQMPKLHGGEVAQRLRQRAEFANLRLIGTSAINIKDVGFSDYLNLVDAFVAKPCDPNRIDELLSAPAG